MRQEVIAGNWKMHKTIEEAVAFTRELAEAIGDKPAYLAVPFTAIGPTAEASAGTSLVIGAQNMNDATEGAFTGEIAAQMLIDAGAKFVILGHSERRHIFNESNDFINRKVRKALDEGLQPIVCVGETLSQRENNEAEETVEKQIIESLAGISAEEMQKVILAYEPVWAIGTGKTATPEMAEEMHRFCREVVKKNWDEETAEAVTIQYGGSVKPDNVKELMEQPDIDGVLVGGASLSVDSLSKIINYKE